MTEASTMISRRSQIPRQESRSATEGSQPPAWRNPSRRIRMIVVGAVYGIHGFLAGALVGAFLGRFLLPACVGAIVVACCGAWLEGRS